MSSNLSSFLLSSVLFLLFVTRSASATEFTVDLGGIYKGHIYQHNKKSNPEKKVDLKWESTVELEDVKAKVMVLSDEELELRIKGTLVTKRIKCKAKLINDTEFNIREFAWKDKILVGTGSIKDQTLEIELVVKGSDEVAISYKGVKSEDAARG